MEKTFSVIIKYIAAYMFLRCSLLNWGNSLSFLFLWEFLIMNGYELLSNIFSALIDLILFLLFHSLNMMDYIDYFLSVEVVL